LAKTIIVISFFLYVLIKIVGAADALDDLLTVLQPLAGCRHIFVFHRPLKYVHETSRKKLLKWKTKPPPCPHQARLAHATLAALPYIWYAMTWWSNKFPLSMNTPDLDFIA
jgi:hypothetical protein